MESSYGIGVKNRYELFYDDEEDPTELLRQQEEEKERRKAEKTTAKDKSKGPVPVKGVKAPVNAAGKKQIKEAPVNKSQERTIAPRDDNKLQRTTRPADRAVKFAPPSGGGRENQQDFEERKNRRNREERISTGGTEARFDFGRYTTMLCDGDSRSYSAVKEAKVYGFINVEKEDCSNHVQKRMGTALRNLVQKHKGDSSERISGKGRLTGDLITKLTSYYGWALKSHSGDVDEMHKAVWATYYHVTSTDEKSNHSFCPHGPESWCKHNAAMARNEPIPKSKYNLPEAVSNALRPVYERLSDKELLQRCTRGKTQNANEALHSVIWSLSPKDKNASLFAVETAVADAVMRFNLGNKESTRSNMHGNQRAVEKDYRRAVGSERKRASSAAFQAAAKKKHKQKPASDYSAGAF
ncbi:hypothetical protein HPB52_011750 [Rhipicephalus sanguineus]|uniref:Uncharacterized protein n=1 Tax=Rhipicephalus sanguineus TaxID=34632 RepID=A0A9D4PDZ8_RHISA|nr:hypothetical protein HPB52_011750 [Rhipicephalus sanguineus]